MLRLTEDLSKKHCLTIQINKQLPKFLLYLKKHNLSNLLKIHSALNHRKEK